MDEQNDLFPTRAGLPPSQHRTLNGRALNAASPSAEAVLSEAEVHAKEVSAPGPRTDRGNPS